MPKARVLKGVRNNNYSSSQPNSSFAKRLTTRVINNYRTFMPVHVDLEHISQKAKGKLSAKEWEE